MRQRWQVIRPRSSERRCGGRALRGSTPSDHTCLGSSSPRSGPTCPWRNCWRPRTRSRSAPWTTSRRTPSSPNSCCVSPARTADGAIADFRVNWPTWTSDRGVDRPADTARRRNLATDLGISMNTLRFLIRDRDSKQHHAFDAVFQAADTEIIKASARAPKANVHCGRVIGPLCGEHVGHIRPRVRVTRAAKAWGRASSRDVRSRTLSRAGPVRWDAMPDTPTISVCTNGSEPPGRAA